MNSSRDIVRIARQRAGLTQQQLADLSGHPRETISRWEGGVQEPSLASLRKLAEASGLDLVIHLAQRDTSLAEAVDDQLALSPADRLERLLPGPNKDEAIRALLWLAESQTPLVVIGAMAGALQGAPQRPGNGRVDFVSADRLAMEAEMRAGGLTPSAVEDRWGDLDTRDVWALPEGGMLALASNVPATGDFPDLRRDARMVELEPGIWIPVAHPRDLLRIADASPRETERARVPGLRALLDRTADA